ncbi:MAG: hypothetical protein PHT19_13375 [Methylococcus sp.]|nr:hypothetical protein [Methylococcus sp.]
MRSGKFYLVIAVIVLIVVAIEGDLVIELLSHAVELALEALEMLLDTVFEAVLGLTPRGAQVLTAWLAVGMIVGFGALVAGKVARGWKERVQQIDDLYHESADQAAAWYLRNRLKIIVIGAAIGALVMLFMF